MKKFNRRSILRFLGLAPAIAVVPTVAANSSGFNPLAAMETLSHLTNDPGVKEQLARDMATYLLSEELYARKVVLFEREDGWFDVDPEFPAAAHRLAQLSRIEIEGTILVPGIPKPFLEYQCGRRNDGQMDLWFKVAPDVAETFAKNWWSGRWVALVRR